MISDLVKERNFEIVNLSIIKRYSSKQYFDSVISFVRVIIIQLWVNAVFLKADPKFISFSCNQKSIIAFIKI